MPAYTLATVATPEGPRAALLTGDQAILVSQATGRARDETVLGLLEDWEGALGRLDALAASGAGVPRETVELLVPVDRPGVIFCAGANYFDHTAEMAAQRGDPPPPDPHTLGLAPWFFIKAARTLAGPGRTVALPRDSRFVDWEAELVVVIGRKGKDIPEAEALDHVAGYTAANDLSARDLGKREKVPDTAPFKYDWIAHKNFDGACPLGPSITLARDIPDPHALSISLTVNGVDKQRSSTAQMIYSIPEQIAALSRRMTLHPGDLILTGTPAGVGLGRGESLRPGDVVRISIEGIGELETRFA